MTTPPLPDRWSDEPWPLDDPIPTPSLRPTNWSDTHTDPPQVADLADEAWQYAVDHGISMGQALAELQQNAEWAQRHITGPHTGGFILKSGSVTINGVDLTSSVTSWVLHTESGDDPS